MPAACAGAREVAHSEVMGTASGPEASLEPLLYRLIAV